MSYRQQLEGVFTPLELDVLEHLVNHESSTDTTSDVIHNLSASEKRALSSLRDKLRGAQQIRSPRTTSPDKL